MHGMTLRNNESPIHPDKSGFIHLKCVGVLGTIKGLIHALMVSLEQSWFL